MGNLETPAVTPSVRCPRDGAVLSPAGSTGAGLRCPTCVGLLVSGAEIHSAIRAAGVKAAVLDGLRPPAPSCPLCRAEMELRLAGGIEIELCDACHAVWLDHGELDKLNRYMSADPVVTAFPKPAEEDLGWIAPSPDDWRRDYGLGGEIAREAAAEAAVEIVAKILRMFFPR